MKDNEKELAKKWLEKAHNDLISAYQILKLKDGPTDTVCFHSQQAIEKAIKGYLTYKSIEFTKIHDLVRLLEMVKPALPLLENYREKLDEINSYAVDIRYPDFFEEPTREEAEIATNIADDILTMIKNLII